jgi:hypothetical protein
MTIKIIISPFLFLIDVRCQISLDIDLFTLLSSF